MNDHYVFSMSYCAAVGMTWPGLPLSLRASFCFRQENLRKKGHWTSGWHSGSIVVHMSNTTVGLAWLALVVERRRTAAP